MEILFGIQHEMFVGRFGKLLQLLQSFWIHDFSERLHFTFMSREILGSWLERRRLEIMHRNMRIELFSESLYIRYRTLLGVMDMGIEEFIGRHRVII